MEHTITIRPIVPADVMQLTAMARITFYDTFTGTCSGQDMQDFLDAYFNEARLLEEVNLESNHYYFAEVDGKPAGYIQFAEDYSGLPLMQQWKSLELKRIYVLKEFHGKGIAQKLMALFLDYAQDYQYEAVWLGVWEHNLRAKQFYKKFGFEDSGHTHDFPIGKTPQTDIWMWRKIRN